VSNGEDNDSSSNNNNNVVTMEDVQYSDSEFVEDHGSDISSMARTASETMSKERTKVTQVKTITV